jgi:VWFA-related protein
VQELESTDELYLYVLAPNGGVYAVHPIPDKPTEIDARTPPWSSQAKTLLDKVIQKVNQLRTADMRDIDVRTQASLQNVEGLAALLARFPGRKNFIWVTHGVPDVSYWNDYTADIAKLGTKLNWADIAVYTVQQSATEGISMNSCTTLATLSQLTGGRTYGTDAAQDAIEQSRVDSRVEYSLTYKSPVSQTGKYRKIRVTCDRPGTQVLSQQGYYSVR